MGSTGYAERAKQWREHAAILRRYGSEDMARVIETLADELEGDALGTGDRVTLGAAVEISGFSRAHLRRLVKQGKLTNIGTPGKPEFFVSDLPKKPGYVAPNKRLAKPTNNVLNSRLLQVARGVAQGD